MVISLIYALLSGLSLEHIVLNGASVGFGVSLFSVALVSVQNRYLLPRIDETWWNVISFVSAFIAGFMGSLMALVLLESAHYSLFHDKLFSFSALVGLLNYLIGLIMYKFVLLENTKEDLEKALTESRLKFLESQINPHFLYNMLNSVAELIYLDQKKAEKAVLIFAQMFRNSLRDESHVSLKEELSFLEKYIYLLNIKYNDRLFLTVENRLKEDIMIPKFVIQMLVENAIKHGFDNKPLTITIRVQKEEKFMQIEVKNDGKKAEKIEKGTGLSNIENRLKVLKESKLLINTSGEPTFIIRMANENFDHR